MEEDVEVIFESWVLRLTGLDGRSILRLSSQWKKRYMILIRQHESASILYYNHKPASLSAAPKGIVVLEPYYKVEKRNNVRGQRYVVSLTTVTKRFVVAVDDERIFHLLSFYLQVQVKLNEDVEEECFVVRPDNTDDQRKIGARGNMCLLHISPWGLTVALQLSKCVIVQWPLTCIRNYESTGRGQFIVTVGKRATMGIGRYVFNTRLSQDNVMYDRMDRYVIDAAGIRNSHADNISQTSLMEQDSLHSLTFVQANPQFSNHLRKISRDIYDSLNQHLGSTRLKASSPDLVSDSPHVRQGGFPRSSSTATLDGVGQAVPSNPTTPRQSLRRKMSSPAAFSLSTSTIRSPDDFSSLPRNFRRSSPSKITNTREAKRRIPVEMIESEYLHPDESAYFETYENEADLEMENLAGAMAMSAPLAAVPGIVTGRPPSGSSGLNSTKSPHASISSEPPQSPPAMVRPQRPRLQRLQSRSCEDLMTYMEMNAAAASSPQASNDYVYNEHTGAANSNEIAFANGKDNTDSCGGATAAGYKGYDSSQDEAARTRAAAQKLAQRRLYDGTTPIRDHIPTGYIRKSLVRQSSMKKAMSNPALLDNDESTSPTDSQPVTHSAALKPPLPFNVKYQKGTDPQTLNTSPTGKPQIRKSPTPVTSLVTSSSTASLGAAMPAGASPMTSRALFMITPKGINTTSKTKIFRRPTSEQSPTKTGYVPKVQDDHRRQESTSSGYASGGGGESDLRETHC